MSLLSGIPIIGKIIDGVVGYSETRQKIRQIKDEGAIKLAQTKVDAKIKQASSDADSAGDLDRIALENVGWKDEFLMIVVTIPMILVFFPPMIPYVKAGFIALGEMPEYYQYMVGGVFVYVFGFKRIMLKVINAFIAVRFGRLPQVTNTTVVVEKELEEKAKIEKEDTLDDERRPEE